MEKMRMFIESLKYIDECYPAIFDRRVAVSKMLDEIKSLQNHSTCPTCKHEFSDDEKQSVKDEMLVIQAKYDELVRLSDEEYKAGEPLREVKRKAYVRNQENARKARDGYIKSHKSMFKKIIRDFRCGDHVMLPDVPDDEKKLWNDAIECFVGNRMSYDDITFNLNEVQYDI